MKAYKVELLIVDSENVGEHEIRFSLQNVRYLYPTVKSIQARDIGEWHDDHPLNRGDESYYQELFKPPAHP